MDHVEEFINSGILELYVLGSASPEDIILVQKMEAAYPTVRAEIDLITEQLMERSAKNAPHTSLTVKPLLLATISYIERIANGEPVSYPPVLNQDSKIEDYATWLGREDMVLPENYEGIHIRLLGHTPELTSAIVWIDDETPFEVHDHEYEKFLIVEGSCDIIIDEKPYPMMAGDYMCIPLYSGHIVKVTSAIPCKVILQRQAA